MRLNIVSALPATCDAVGRTTSAHYITQTVIHTHLVVEIIKARGQIRTILIGIVYLTNKDQTRVPHLDNGSSIMPKLMRHHLCHITAKTVNALSGPIEQDIGHFRPCIRDGIKMSATATGIAIVYAVVEFHRLVPIVEAWVCIEMVIARTLCRHLLVGRFPSSRSHRTDKRLARTVIEIVLRIEMLSCIIALT